MEPQNFWYQKLKKNLFCSLEGHIRILFYDLDCVKDQSVYGFTKDDLLLSSKKEQNCHSNPHTQNSHSDQSSNRSKQQLHYNVTYFYPFLIALYIALDGLVLLAQNGYRYEPTKMETLSSHLIFPRNFWPQSDIMYGLAIAMSVIIFPLLMIDPMLDQKFVMYLLDCNCPSLEKVDRSSVEILMIDGCGCGSDSQTEMAALPKDETAAIVAFRRRACPLIGLMMITLTVQAESFAIWNLYAHWSHFLAETDTGLRLYILALAIILFFFYGNISNLYMLYYFGLTTRYIRIKQRSRRQQVTKLATMIDQKIANSFSTSGNGGGVLNQSTGSNKGWTNRRKELQNSSLWRSLQKVNRQILALFKEIRAQNRFWSKYLTIYFLVYIIEIVYAAYSYFFNDTSELGVLQLFFPIFGGNFTLVLVLVTLECSQIVNKNCQLHQQTARAQMSLQRIYPLKVSDLLTVDSMAANYRNIPQICFKMLNNYRINSQMFQMLFSYTSLLFLMVVRKN